MTSLRSSARTLHRVEWRRAKEAAVLGSVAGGAADATGGALLATAGGGAPGLHAATAIADDAKSHFAITPALPFRIRAG